MNPPRLKNTPPIPVWAYSTLFAPLLGLSLLGLWIWAAETEQVKPFLLPHPQAVLERMQTLYERGVLMGHIQTTAQEAALGWALALGLALPLGYAVARSRWLSALLLPYLVAIRAIPVVAIAALIVIWLGTGLQSKVFVAAFITWFPLMEATIAGLRSLDPKLHDLLRAYQASPWQIFWKLELPSALPSLFSGLKISATLAVVGAAVAELVGSNQGLAYLILFGRGTSDAPLVYGAVLLLTALSLSFYGLVALAEAYCLRWRRLGR